MTADVYRIEVSDTGRGMNEEERANAVPAVPVFFDGGTGIGMAIVYQHRPGARRRALGRERARSAAPRSTVELPTAQPRSALVETGGGLRRDAVRLLIVDDESSLLDFLTLLSSRRATG